MPSIKGFLTQVAKAVLGLPAPRDTVPAVPDMDMDVDLRALEMKWRNAPFILAADFIGPFYKTVKACPDPDSGVSGYASFKHMDIVSNLQRAMVSGQVPFFFPRPGTYNYPVNEKDMFFTEHCLVPISYFIQKAREKRDCGSSHAAALYIRTLKQVAEEATAIPGGDIDPARYGYEAGTNAQSRYFMSVYEPGGPFCLVLRHRKGEMERVIDTAQNIYSAPPSLPAGRDAPKLPQL